MRLAPGAQRREGAVRPGALGLERGREVALPGQPVLDDRGRGAASGRREPVAPVHGVELVVESEARAWLAERGYDVKMGARPMARVIQDHIKKPLAEELLFGRLANGGQEVVRVSDNEIELDVSPRETAEA